MSLRRSKLFGRFFLVLEQLYESPNSKMLYLSEYGESLEEKGPYLQAFLYNLAPVGQTPIPMVY